MPRDARLDAPGTLRHVMIRGIERLVESTCNKAGISLKALKAGSRQRAVASVRKSLTIRLLSDSGLTLAETARHLGVSTSAIAQILRRLN